MLGLESSRAFCCESVCSRSPNLFAPASQPRPPTHSCFLQLRSGVTESPLGMPETRKCARKAPKVASNKLAAKTPLSASAPTSPYQSHGESDSGESDTESSTISSKRDNSPSGGAPALKEKCLTENSSLPLNPPCTTSSAASTVVLPTSAMSSTSSASSAPDDAASISSHASTTSLPMACPCPSTSTNAPSILAVSSPDPDQVSTVPPPPVPAAVSQQHGNFVVCVTPEDSSRAFIHPSRVTRALEASPFHGKIVEGSLRITGGGFGLRFEVKTLSCLSQAPESVTRLGEWTVRCWVIDPDPSSSYTYGRIYPVDARLTNDALTASIKVLWGTQSPIIRVSRLPPSRGADGEEIPNLAIRLKFKGPLPDKVAIDGLTYTVRPHTLPALQCYRCLSYGHGKAVCRGSTRCRTCSGPHDASGCTKAPSCFYCLGKHHPTSRFCPASLAASAIQQEFQEGKLSFAQERQKLRDIKPGSFQLREQQPTAAPRAPAVSVPRSSDVKRQVLPTPSAPPLTEESHLEARDTNALPASSPAPQETAPTSNPQAVASHPETDLSLPMAPHTHTDPSLPVPQHPTIAAAPQQIPILQTPPRNKPTSPHCPSSPPKSTRPKQPYKITNPVQIYPLQQHPFRNPQSLTPPPSSQPPPTTHPDRPVPWPHQPDEPPPPSSSTHQEHTAASSPPNDSSWSSLIASLFPIITTFFTSLMSGLSLSECFLKILPSIQTLITSLLSSP